MTVRWRKTLLLGPDDVPPSQDDLRVVGVFNPGAVIRDGRILLLARVAEAPRDSRPGHVGLPRHDGPAGRVVVDWLPEAEVRRIDVRMVRHECTACVRPTTISHLRWIDCGAGDAVAAIGPPAVVPSGPLEEYGVEDPRLTVIAGRVHATFVAVSRHGIATALAAEAAATGPAAWPALDRRGLILPPDNKDVVLFPDAGLFGADGRGFCAVHRPESVLGPPEMWTAVSPDLTSWGGHRPLHVGTEAWERERVGAGPPPFRCGGRWALVYHGRAAAAAGRVGRYSAGLLAIDCDPQPRVVGRLAVPILEPTEPFEREGFVPDVVFPTGLVERGDEIVLAYGAADTCCALAAAQAREFAAAVARACA